MAFRNIWFAFHFMSLCFVLFQPFIACFAMFHSFIDCSLSHWVIGCFMPSSFLSWAHSFIDSFTSSHCISFHFMTIHFIHSIPFDSIPIPFQFDFNFIPNHELAPHSFIHTFIHSFIHIPFTHWFIRSAIRALILSHHLIGISVTICSFVVHLTTSTFHCCCLSQTFL